MGTRWRMMILMTLLFTVILLRFFYPMAVERTRAKAMRILAEDLNNLELVETLGRMAAKGNWQEELAEAFLTDVFSRGT